jgi:simple sugar transport system substrate-binding protein
MESPVAPPQAVADKKTGLAVVAVILILAGVAAVLGYKYWTLAQATSSANQVTGASGQWCRGVNLDFFGGGSEQDPFSSVVYNGAQTAQKDLGANVKYIWSGWDSGKMASQFKDAVAESPDGIAMMGHPGSDVLGPLIDEAERHNIIVTLMNVDLPDIRGKYLSNGFGYVGQNLYNSGLLISKGLVQKYSLKSGTEAIVFGVDPANSPSRYERTKGCVDGLQAGGLVVHDIPLPPEIDNDTNSPAALKFFTDALAKYPDVRTIITDHGSMTASVPSYLKSMGKKPGEYVVGGFDLSTATVNGIESGYIGLIHDQQPFLQGYLPVLQVCLTKKYGFAGLNIDTGVGLIDNTNVNVVAQLAQNKFR